MGAVLIVFSAGEVACRSPCSRVYAHKSFRGKLRFTDQHGLRNFVCIPTCRRDLVRHTLPIFQRRCCSSTPYSVSSCGKGTCVRACYTQCVGNCIINNRAHLNNIGSTLPCLLYLYFFRVVEC